MKDKHVIGGKVKSGLVRKNGRVRIKRANEVIGEGTIVNLQSGKQNVDTINEGDEFGAQVQSDVQLQNGDVIECYEMVVK